MHRYEGMKNARLLVVRFPLFCKLIWLLLFRVHHVAIAEIAESHRQQIKSIVNQVHVWKDERRLLSRPFISLAFAQSLDAKIATYNDDLTVSQNLPISGRESLYMTHALRSMHDAILVGGKTFLCDNPRLNNRLWGNEQPRPIILDANLKYLKKVGKDRRVKDAIVCCGPEAFKEFHDDTTGITLVVCKVDDDGRLNLHDVVQQLSSSFGIMSIMVEGGSGMLTSFASNGLVDCICVTVAPKLIGVGLQAFSLHTRVDFNPSASYFIPLGEDCIFLAQWPTEPA